MGCTTQHGKEFPPRRVLRQTLLLVCRILHVSITPVLLLSPGTRYKSKMVQISIALRSRIQFLFLVTVLVHGDPRLRVSFSLLLYLLACCTSNQYTNRPVYAYWSFPEPAGTKCMKEAPVTLVGGLVKIAVDILITTLPIPLIMHMKMQKKQRYMVSLLLGLGYIVCIAGAVRTYFTWKSAYATNDPIWYEYPAFIAAALENNLAIVRRRFFSSLIPS